MRYLMNAMLGPVFCALFSECRRVRGRWGGAAGCCGFLGSVLRRAGLVSVLLAETAVGVGLGGTVVHCKL